MIYADFTKSIDPELCCESNRSSVPDSFLTADASKPIDLQCTPNNLHGENSSSTSIGMRYNHYLHHNQMQHTVTQSNVHLYSKESCGNSILLNYPNGSTKPHFSRMEESLHYQHGKTVHIEQTTPRLLPRLAGKNIPIPQSPEVVSVPANPSCCHIQDSKKIHSCNCLSCEEPFLSIDTCCDNLAREEHNCDDSLLLLANCAAMTSDHTTKGMTLFNSYGDHTSTLEFKPTNTESYRNMTTQHYSISSQTKDQRQPPQYQDFLMQNTSSPQEQGPLNDGSQLRRENDLNS